MQANELFNPEKISILEYKYIKGQIDTPEDFNIEKVKGHDLENTLQLGFNLDDKLAKADFFFNIQTKSSSDNQNEASGAFHLVFIYKIENIEELVSISKEGHLEVNSWLGNALASITYSTSRGILLTRLQGTVFQNFILPVINPDNLL